MTLPTEKTPGKSANVGFASRRFTPALLYYAQRAVDVAISQLWLIGGIPMDGSVTVLEVRRRFEIPTALCSAPGREVALTAQRLPGEKTV